MSTALPHKPATPGKALGLPKQQRLAHKPLIDLLFKEGQAVSSFPLKFLWLSAAQLKAYEEGRNSSQPLPLPAPPLPAVLFVVPKRGFKKATDRNRHKRQLREAYRHSKHIFIDTIAAGQPYIAVLAIIYTRPAALPYARLQQKVIDLLHKTISANK